VCSGKRILLRQAPKRCQARRIVEKALPASPEASPQKATAIIFVVHVAKLLAVAQRDLGSSANPDF
jgi:hypothetical protein